MALICRLNEKLYNEQDFVDAGIEHVDAFFLEGSCPSLDLVLRVVAAMDVVPDGKAFAVHCLAGIGRTGTCIGAYLIKRYGFSAKDSIAWMRICRPGMVVGPQQLFLEEIQHRMCEAGVAAGYIAEPLESSESPSLGEGVINSLNAKKQSDCQTLTKCMEVVDLSDANTDGGGLSDGLPTARSS